MNTIHLQENISYQQYQMVVRVLEAMNIKVEKEPQHNTNEMLNKVFLKSKEQIAKGQTTDIRELLKIK